MRTHDLDELPTLSSSLIPGIADPGALTTRERLGRGAAFAGLPASAHAPIAPLFGAVDALMELRAVLAKGVTGDTPDDPIFAAQKRHAGIWAFDRPVGLYLQHPNVSCTRAVVEACARIEATPARSASIRRAFREAETAPVRSLHVAAHALWDVFVEALERDQAFWTIPGLMRATITPRVRDGKGRIERSYTSPSMPELIVRIVHDLPPEPGSQADGCEVRTRIEMTDGPQ